MYSAADILLLNQKAAVKDAVIPSKLLTYMAAGRAVLAAVSEKSEAARQIRNAQCGMQISAEDPAAMVEAVSQLRQDEPFRRKLGASGRAYAILNFTKQRVLLEYDELFQRVSGEKTHGIEISKKAAAAG